MHGWLARHSLPMLWQAAAFTKAGDRLVECFQYTRDTAQVGSVSYERQPIADHAINLASTIQLNLKRSLEALGVVCPSSVPQVPLQ